MATRTDLVNPGTMLDPEAVTHRGYTFSHAFTDEILSAAGVLPSSLPITFFPPGSPPRGGTEEEPVTDSEVYDDTLEAWGKWFTSIAGKSIPKGRRAICFGVGRYGGSSDAEAERVTWITLDSDKNERPESLLALLRRAGLSYIFQARETPGTKETRGSIKWHLHLPLTAPLDEESKPLFSEKYHFLLGYLGGRGGLRHGLDAAMGNRRMQPVYPYTRRPEDAPDLVVRTEYHVAGALDVEKLLSLVSWQPLSPRLPLTRNEAIPGETAAAPDLAGAFAAAGLAVPRTGRQKKWVDVVCPWAEGHTPGTGNTAGVMTDSGSFNCFHSSCSHRSTRDAKKWLRENHPAITARFLDHDDHANLKALVADADSIRASDLVAEDESLADRVREAVLAAEPGTVTVITVPTGGGKTEGALDALRELRIGIILSPTNALAEEIESRLLDKGAITERHKGVLAARNPNDEKKEYYCLRIDEAKEVQAIGLSIPHNLCPSCPRKKECDAARPVGKGDVLIGPHAMASGLVTLGKKKLEVRDKTGVFPKPPLIIDEDFAPFDHFDVSRSDLQKANEILRRGDGDEYGPMLTHLVTDDYRAAVLPWIRVLELAWDLQSLDAGFRLWRDENGLEVERSLDAVRERARNAPHRMIREYVDARDFRDELSALRRIIAGAWHWKWSTRGEVHSAFSPSVVYRIVREYEGPVIILSATPDVQYWESKGATVVTIDVPEDPALVARHLYYMSNSHRRALNTPKGIAKVRRRIEAALRACAKKLGPDAKGALVCVARPIAEALRADPIEIDGLDIDVRHYGSTRGLDRWKDFSFCVTVGEDWPNVVTNKLEAEELGIDAFTRSKWVVSAELDQVHGRLRDPRRMTPCIHIHIGSVLPYGWVGNRKPKIHGKGVPQAKSDRDLIQQLLDAMGGERGTLALAAKKLGIPRASLSNYRRGRAMPPVIRMKIEAAIMEQAA